MPALLEDVRTTADDVRLIFSTDLLNDQLAQFQNMAHLLVVRGGAPLTELGEDLLSHLELLLAAHFAALRDPRMSRESVADEYEYSSQGRTGMGLDATFYGQQAKLLDSTGTLALIAAGKLPATIEVLYQIT